MSVSSHDGSLGRSGLIIPENIPGDDLQPFRLEAVAGRVRQAGSLALQQAELAEATWSGLPGVLESPQGAVMYAALGTPSSLAATIEHKFDRVAYALEEFAAALRPIKNEFARIKEDAVAFRATIRWDERVWVSPAETHEYQFDAQASVTATRGYVRTADEVVEYLQGRGESTLVTGGRVKILAHWTQSSSHVDANNALMDRLADAYARLQNVEADCADAINRQRDLCMAEVQKIEAWQLKQSGENTVVLPWGSKVDEDRNCGEQFWWGVGNAGKEAGVGFLGLFGYNGVRDDWTPEQAGQSWLGAVQGIGALLVLTCPPLVLLGKAGVPVLSDATDMGDAMLKGLIAYDTWAENPAEAAGRVLVNVGSLFIPGAGEVSAAIKALTAGSRIVDAAGDAARLGESALSGLNRLDNLTGAFDDLALDGLGALRYDDLIPAGKFDMPDSDVLHVGTRVADPDPQPGWPPTGLLDDGRVARPEHYSTTPLDADASTPGSSSAPSAQGSHSDSPTPPHTNLSDPPPHASPDGAPLSSVDWREIDLAYRLDGEIAPARIDDWAQAVSEQYPTLTPDDVKGIHDYTTDAGYSAMNSYLRNWETLDPFAAASLEARITATTDALAKLPPQAGTFHRGVGFTDEFLAQFKTGEPWSDPSFMSSSVDLDVAMEFAQREAASGKMPGIIEVMGQTGVDVRPISAFQREAEVLFQRGTTFEVVSGPAFIDGFWRVTLREVAP